MTGRHITIDDFEALYRSNPDPWDYATSSYERDKYEATLEACGPGPFERALELGASIGLFSRALAPRCRSLTTIDAAPTAVTAARDRLAARPGVDVRLGRIPDDLAADRYDLVIASEVLYYLEPDALAATLERLAQVLVPGGRLVAVHWRPTGPERPFTADAVHAQLRRQPWLEALEEGGTEDYLLDVLRRR